MGGSIFKVFGFLLIVLGVYLWIGYSVTALTGGGGGQTTSALDISPEGGEAIYWGKGSCYTCHSVGGQGSAVRGPNHGAFGERFALGMGARAVERAAERSAKEGVDYTAVDYVVESLVNPSAYVVEGYKNEMPAAFKPPMSLSLNEIKAVVSYLMTLGGDLDLAAIDTAPSELTASFYSEISGGASAGEAPATDTGEPRPAFTEAADLVAEFGCDVCHMLGGEGGEVGPNLSAIGAKRDRDYLRRAVLTPNADIAEGFAPDIMPHGMGDQIYATEIEVLLDFLTGMK